MDGKRKRRWGDRRDGFLVRDNDALHVFMPYLLRNRADSEAFISEQIDLTRINAYLAKKNADNPAYKYTVFHVFAAAIHKTVTLRPKLNRFIAGRRMYERHGVSIAFVAKKQFLDEGAEALLFLEFDENSSVDTIHDRIYKEVSEARAGKVDNSSDFIEKLAKLPRFILRIVMQLLMILDYYGKAPYFLVKEDPDFASIYLSNLGSIKLNAGYHHLNNWGTNSLFVVLGEKYESPFYDKEKNLGFREMIPVGITLDERIADGYYYAKSIKLLKYLLNNPEILERPSKEEVCYE